jgi:uncharacterized protein YbaA (DUF1428 family)
MTYVDGFLLPLPKKNLAAYRRMAKLGSKIWLSHGALEYRECVGDDLTPPFGLPFTGSVKAKRGETVVFAWIVFKSRAQRDRINAKVMQDKRMLTMATKPMPFDCTRMVYGGFEVLVEGAAKKR